MGRRKTEIDKQQMAHWSLMLCSPIPRRPWPATLSDPLATHPDTMWRRLDNALPD